MLVNNDYITSEVSLQREKEKDNSNEDGHLGKIKMVTHPNRPYLSVMIHHLINQFC